MMMICHFGSGSGRDSSSDRMSSGLMSCVREHSPPLEMDANESGALSLPDASMTEAAAASASVSLAPTSPGAKSANCDSTASTAELQKRRRFHPLRNLRRIFRRRTITSTTNANTSDRASPASGSTALSDKDLRSATISAITSVIPASISSPCSPLTHQLMHTNSLSGSKSLPKSKAGAGGGGGGGGHRHVLVVTTEPRQQQQLKKQQTHHLNANADIMYLSGQIEAAEAAGSSSSRHHQHQHHQQQHQQQVYNISSVLSTALSTELHPLSSVVSAHRSSAASMGGVAVLPAAFNAAALHRSFFAERQKLKKSLGDSSQELDSSTASSLTGSGSRRGGNAGKHNHSQNAGSSSVREAHEITDSQRSFSEGRLMDGDYGRDGLSQSHDSVFSESATASSFSIVLKSELADALRKRRNRPDASDEDLGLPRSPASPQRRNERITAANASTPNASTPNASTPNASTAGNHSEVSSLSMLSMNSNDGDLGLFADSTPSSVIQERSFMTCSSQRYSRISAMSQALSSDILRQSSISNKSDMFGEIDGVRSDWQRLSHSAAKHKMAVRPAKKKGPSRQHRRTLETSIPEANEELFKIGGSHLLDLTDDRAKARSLPPAASIKSVDQEIGDSKIEPPTASVTVAAATDKTNVIIVNDSTPQQTSINSGSNTEHTPSASDNNNDASSATAVPSSSKPQELRASSDKTSSLSESISEAPKPETVKEEIQPTQAMETSENGFIRRLIQRNSKRTISKANGDDVPDIQSGPTKVQIPSSAYETREFYKTPKCVLGYDEQIRKSIERKIASESNAGLSAMLDPYIRAPINDWGKTTTSTSARDTAGSPQKPKSGPAARQRYLPQEIPSSNTLEKSRRSGNSKSLSRESFSSTTLAKSPNEESFQSTSIIRQITASQCGVSGAKADHHFEKKPKILGLSSFQQKVSRSNDSCARSTSNITSSTAVNVSEENVFLSPDQKSRKAVEKSRSFRTYNEDKDFNAGVHNNMPSLPDLSLQLPRFGEFILNEKEYSSPSPPDYSGQSTSLGFEINDNNLVRLTQRAESSSSLSPFGGGGSAPPNKNIVMTSKPSTASKLLAPTTTMLPSLSPTNSIAEIEETIDMIVKSPFVSILRKSANMSDQTAESLQSPTVVGQGSEAAASRVHSVNDTPRSNFNSMPKEVGKSEEKLSSTAVTITAIREKAPSSVTGKANMEFVERKEAERKSIATASPASACQTNSFSRTRRSSSVIESSAGENSNPAVPEFLKIQLNRVDPGTRVPKSTVVLAKNVKETPKETADRSTSIGDLSLLRFSVESIESLEIETPGKEKSTTGLFEAINNQTKSVSNNSIRCKASDLPPKSPPKKSPQEKKTSTTPSLQLTGNLSNTNTPPNTPVTPPPTTPITPTEEVVILRQKPDMISTSTNKLSLQERKRLFMNEEKAKADKRIEDLKNERKKSINEEMQRKSNSGKDEVRGTTSAEPIEKETVILRKKSFGGSNHSCSGTTNSTHSNHSTTTTTTNSSTNNNNNNSSGKDDATPELMKVFARRSLKIKDEDLVHLTDKILPAHNVTGAQLPPLKKSPALIGQSNVDSDKENQSASEEKLDQISPKFEVVAIEQINNKVVISNVPSSISKSSTAVNSNRNSLADFRKNAGHQNGLSTQNNNNNANNYNNNSSNNNNHNVYQTNNGSISNNNNNINNHNNSSNTATLPGKSYLPPHGRINGGFRTISVVEQRNGGDRKSLLGVGGSEAIANHNNNKNSNSKNNSFNTNPKTSLERQSLCIRTGINETSGNIGSGSKTIERSATMGEFKGIHQRRAEWEQRAKEALK